MNDMFFSRGVLLPWGAFLFLFCRSVSDVAIVLWDQGSGMSDQGQGSGTRGQGPGVRDEGFLRLDQ